MQIKMGSILMSLTSGLVQFLGSRKFWAIIFLFMCGASYLAYANSGIPTIIVVLVFFLFFASTIFRVKEFGGTASTFLWVLLPPVFILSCLFMKRKLADEAPAANQQIRDFFSAIMFGFCVLGLGLGYAWEHWFDEGEKEVRSVDRSRGKSSIPSYSECYQNGLDYYKSIGVDRLTTYPDKGRRAEDVVEERCMASSFAFGR